MNTIKRILFSLLVCGDPQCLKRFKCKHLERLEGFESV